VGKDSKTQTGVNFPLSLSVKPEIFKK